MIMMIMIMLTITALMIMMIMMMIMMMIIIIIITTFYISRGLILIPYLTIKQPARVVYEQIVNEAQRS